MRRISHAAGHGATLSGPGRTPCPNGLSSGPPPRELSDSRPSAPSAGRSACSGSAPRPRPDARPAARRLLRGGRRRRGGHLARRRPRRLHRHHRRRGREPPAPRDLDAAAPRRPARGRAVPVHRPDARGERAALVPRRQGAELPVAPGRRGRRRRHLVRTGRLPRRRGVPHRGRPGRPGVVARRRVDRLRRARRARREPTAGTRGLGRARRGHPHPRPQPLRRPGHHHRALQARRHPDPAAPSVGPAPAPALRRAGGGRRRGAADRPGIRRARAGVVGRRRAHLLLRRREAGRRNRHRSRERHLRGRARRRRAPEGHHRPRQRNRPRRLARRTPSRVPPQPRAGRADGHPGGRRRRRRDPARHPPQPHPRLGHAARRPRLDPARRRGAVPRRHPRQPPPLRGDGNRRPHPAGDERATGRWGRSRRPATASSSPIR